MVIIKRVKLYFTDESIKKTVEDRVERFTKCVNYWIDVIREKQSTSLRDLQGLPYFKARELFGLDGVTVQLAELFAVRLARTTKKRRSDTPHIKSKFLVMRTRIKDNQIFFTTGDRKKNWIEFKGEKLPEGKLCESRIKKINNEWYCLLSIKVKEEKPKNFKKCIGVDLGIAKTAVVSDWKGRDTKFFDGEPYRFKKNHYREMRRKLQPKIKEGNVYKLLNRLSKKEIKWVTNENHRISREIVEIAIKKKRSIALEKLTGIVKRLKVNKKTRIMLKGWSFNQLANFIEYKAKLAGITVVYIDPRGTSKTCPKCQYCYRGNRRTQSVFKCRQCNYESNADRVGAMNIALRGNTELSA